MQSGTPTIGRRTVLGAALAAPLATLGAGARAQDKFPSRSLTLVLALAPGGAGDVISRRITQKMTEHMGQSIVIENRPGAGAIAAAQAVMQAKPDGYTMLLSGNGTAVSTAMFRSLPYNITKDFRSVSTLAFFDLGLVVDGQSRFTSVAELLAFAKANPGKLTIASTRIGSTQNLGAEMLKSMAGVEAVIVPYKSTADLLGALRTGDVQVAVEIVPAILGQIQSKQVKELGVAASKRFPGLPDVPTVGESGLPGFEAPSWAGISVPAKTPDAVVRYLAREVELAVASPEVQSALQAQGYVARASTPDEMTQRLQQDTAKWKAVVDKAGIPKQ
jgi:tripartite-type tricarboxylate transporter receptor subunit TctC